MSTLLDLLFKFKVVILFEIIFLFGWDSLYSQIITFGDLQVNCQSQVLLELWLIISYCAQYNGCNKKKKYRILLFIPLQEITVSLITDSP